jgi:hypothetical protein
MDTTATDTTPVTTTTEAVPAAPATSAPASSSPTSERPTDVRSLAAFLQKGATQPETPTAPTETAATVPAVEAKPDGVQPNDKAKGPIPFDAHHTALENARTKTRADVEAEWAPYGWAKQIDRTELESTIRLAQEISRDPVAHVERLVAEMLSHPEHGPRFRSHAGRILASARGGPAVDMSPDVIVQNDQGQEVSRTFSADRVKAIVEHAVNDAIGKHVLPLKQERDARAAQEKAAADKQALTAKVDTVMTRVDKLLEIGSDTSAEDKKTLYAALDALVAKGTDPYDAAMTVREQHVEPMRQKRAEAKALDTYNKKAAGNTANGRGTTATPTKLKSREDIAKFLQQRAG